MQPTRLFNPRQSHSRDLPRWGKHYRGPGSGPSVPGSEEERVGSGLLPSSLTGEGKSHSRYPVTTNRAGVAWEVKCLPARDSVDGGVPDVTPYFI